MSSADDPWWLRRADWLVGCIDAGKLTDHQDPAFSYPLRKPRVGRIELPDGLLVATDPHLMDKVVPFEQALVPGFYDVVVVHATVAEGHERIAAAVLFPAAVDPLSIWPVGWDMATLPGQDTASLPEGEFFGYGVDSSTGCFASPSAAVVLRDVLAEDGGMLEAPLSRELEATGYVVGPPRDGAERVAMFSSGWGDGTYPTWLARDTNGAHVVAVTDFLVAKDPYAT